MHDDYDFILIDLNSIFYRSKHVTNSNDSIDLRTAFAIHITFKILEKVIKKFSNDKTKLVFALDGKSWRYELNKKYKIERKVKKAKRSIKEKIEDEKFNEVFIDFVSFLDKKTNVIVLWHPILEADDLISVFSRFVDGKKIIISNDNDFIQLIEKKTHFYIAHKDIIVKNDHAITFNGEPISISLTNSGKIKIEKSPIIQNLDEDWKEWALFLKICRGDTADCIFPVMPRVRLNILEKAFRDRKNKGYNWNNFMLTCWSDNEGNQYRVLERYEENKLLIDLTNLPEEIENLAKEHIKDKMKEKRINNIGIHFLKFCGKYELKEISDKSNFWANILSR